MDPLQLGIWAATVAGLSGLALAFFKSERLAVRLGALGLFAAFYFAVLLWAPRDELWFNITTVSILMVTFGSRMRRPDDAGKPEDAATGDPKGTPSGS